MTEAACSGLSTSQLIGVILVAVVIAVHRIRVGRMARQG